MNTSSFDKIVWLYEKFPLTRLQHKNLAVGLAESKVAPHLQKYFSMPAGIKYAESRRKSLAVR